MRLLLLILLAGFDDDVQGFALTFEDLAWASGQGPIESSQSGDVFALTLEVEPEF